MGPVYAQSQPFVPQVRYAVGPDWEAITDIDNDTSVRPWSMSDLRRHIAQLDCTAMVATIGPPGGPPEIVAGFMVYSNFEDNGFQVLKLGVARRYQRLGVGTKLLADIKKKAQMSYTRRRVVLAVPERSSDAHSFLRAHDVRACKVLRRWFGVHNDAYMFVYSADAPPKGRPLPGA